MRLTCVVSAIEMLSTAVVATSSNNNRETTVARATSGRLDKSHKAVIAEIFNRKGAFSPRRFNALAVKKIRPAAPATATTTVNLATMRGSVAVHPNKTD